MLVIQPHTDVFNTGKVLVPEVRIKMRLYFNSPVLLLNGVGLAGRLQPEDIEMRFHLCQLRLYEAVYKILFAKRHNERELASYLYVKWKPDLQHARQSSEGSMEMWTKTPPAFVNLS